MAGEGRGSVGWGGSKVEGSPNFCLGGPMFFFEGASSVSCPSGMYKKTHLEYIFNRKH